jgi:hypothetical protein
MISGSAVSFQQLLPAADNAITYAISLLSSVNAMIAVARGQSSHEVGSGRDSTKTPDGAIQHWTRGERAHGSGQEAADESAGRVIDVILQSVVRLMALDRWVTTTVGIDIFCPCQSDAGTEKRMACFVIRAVEYLVFGLAVDEVGYG